MKALRSTLLTACYIVAAAAFVLLQVAVWRQTAIATFPSDGAIPEPSSYSNSRRHLRESRPSKIPKTLVAIFSTLEDTSKTWHRQVFSQFPGRVCPLGDFQTKLSSKERRACQVIYTFVIGVNPSGPTEIVTSGNGAPKLLVKRSDQNFASDIQSEDCTLLNIKENRHDGKSQTFFHFASRVMQEYKIDYVMKVDSATFVNLPAFFAFSDYQLPPSPYNTNILAGALRDKAMWKAKPDPANVNRLEGFWGSDFNGVHLYFDGQLYLLSADITKFVAEEALYARSRIGFGGYMEGSEDHDISGMAWHSPTPIHAIPLALSQRFWTYPVTTDEKWKKLVKKTNH